MSTHNSSFTPNAVFETTAARIQASRVGGRFSLRARGDLSSLNSALGLTLPTKIGQRAQSDKVEALCLGPDEWVLIAVEGAVGEVISACASAYGNLPHSLVDITGREFQVSIEGARAAELLTIGMPRDVASIAVGEGRRTVFDGASVILWRDGENKFRMDIWNSFAGHLFELLETGCLELAAEAA